MENTLITVLNDGETWTETVGTKVMVLSPEQYERVMEDFLEPDDSEFKASMVFDLTSPDDLRRLATYLETGK